jgi:hypothetical protein
MKLSDQALGAVMLALQNSLLHQTDIVPMLKDFELEESEHGLVVKNPPVVDYGSTTGETEKEESDFPNFHSEFSGEGGAIFEAYIDEIKKSAN